MWKTTKRADKTHWGSVSLDGKTFYTLCRKKLTGSLLEEPNKGQCPTCNRRLHFNHKRYRKARG